MAKTEAPGRSAVGLLDVTVMRQVFYPGLVHKFEFSATANNQIWKK